MQVALLSLGSVLAVSLVSLTGVALFLFKSRGLERTLLTLVSFSTGSLLGDVFIHLLPEMAEDSARFSNNLLVVLVGILVSFAIEKVIHWHHCHGVPHEHHYHPVGVLNLFGDGVHNFIDGLAIAASFLVSVPVGFATTVAVVFHEIPQEFGDFAILLHSGYTRRKALLFNLLSASAAILGAAVVLLTSSAFGALNQALLPFAAGNLLYIAVADLIPELHKETGTKQGIIQLLTMIAGIVLMYLLTFLE